jgi:hypothetical protein
MIKTDSSQVPNFVVREATPERIEQLYRMPEVVQLPKIIRFPEGLHPCTAT